jgi:hypothetical protein
MGQVQADDLKKGADKLTSMRGNLDTLLLLHLQPPPVVRQKLTSNTVFGFDQQAAELAAKLLRPGTQVLWLYGMGELVCWCCICNVCMKRSASAIAGVGHSGWAHRVVDHQHLQQQCITILCAAC